MRGFSLLSDNTANSDSPALLSPGCPALTYRQLDSLSRDWTTQLKCTHKQLIFFYISNTCTCVAALLGAIASGNAIALLDPSLSSGTKKHLEDAYKPWLTMQCLHDGSDNISVSQTKYGKCSSRHIHPDLLLLLSTSGSSGSPKFVRLSKDNIESNANAIAQVLDIASDDIALAHLEMHYSYGFSVLTSHLTRGASLGFSNGKFTDRGFWDDVRNMNITHLPGVPYHHDIINRLGLDRLNLPTLRSLTQAGGRLSEASQIQSHASMQIRGGRFYVMYGQTEASPRMTTLDHIDFLNKKGSVGKALPGGEINIVDDQFNVQPSGTTGEVVYSGPNVMLGYAYNTEDLRKGNDTQSVLYTGDKGYIDDEGFLYIVGRQSRMAKIYGLRINLDEIEQYCEVIASDESAAFAAVQRGEEIHLLNNSIPINDKTNYFLTDLADRFSLPPGILKLKTVHTLPHNARGKIDYDAVSAMVSHAG